MVVRAAAVMAAEVFAAVAASVAPATAAAVVAVPVAELYSGPAALNCLVWQGHVPVAAEAGARSPADQW